MALHVPARKAVENIAGRNLVIPEDGWNAQNFVTGGTGLVIALSRLGRITQFRTAPRLAKKLNETFSKQLARVISKVVSRGRGRAGKATLDLMLGNIEGVWAQALREVIAETGVEIAINVMPEVQSVMAQGYSRTSIVLGQSPAVDVGRMVTAESRDIAQRVTMINETTRKRIMESVNRSIEAGLTVAETADQLTSEVSSIYGNRALTIARTELNRAWTRGTLKSMKESETLTHISVIGCEAREANSPQYKGESTCNAVDVPINDADLLLFHVNHTGNIVPSRFRNSDGTFDAAGDRPALLDEEPEG